MNEQTIEEMSGKIDYQKIVFSNLDEFFENEGIKKKDEKIPDSELGRIAEKTNIGISTLRRALNSHKSITTKNLVTIAKKYNLSVDYLLGLSSCPVNVLTYSDVFYYLRYMMDNNMILGNANGDYFLNDKINEIMLQYLKLRGIFRSPEDKEYLESWEKITMRRLDSTQIENEKEFENPFDELKKRMGKTAKDIEEERTITHPTWSKYKSKDTEKRAYPEINQLPEWAKYFSTSVNYLLGLTNNSISEARLLKVLLFLSKNFQRCFSISDSIQRVQLKEYFMCHFCWSYQQQITFFDDEKDRKTLDDRFNEMQKNMSYTLLTDEEYMTCMEYMRANSKSYTNHDIYSMRSSGSYLKEFYSHKKSARTE